MKWVNINTKKPEKGQEIIAVGDWEGEINGFSKGPHTAIGEWDGTRVDIQSDAYYAHIINITHWMPVPKLPRIRSKSP